MSDIAQWFNALPVFTRYWLGLTGLFTLLGRFGILGAHYLYLYYEPFIKRFQVWRAVTSVFYYPLTPSTGFHFMINCYFLYSYSLRLETDKFAGRPADYLFLLIFNWICCVIVGLIAELPFLMDPMVLSVLYIWCQFNKDVIVNFWFGSRFKAMYLPWVLFGFNMIVSGGGIMELVGILVGHLYFVVMFKYPQGYGRTLLSTPSIFYKWFPNRTSGVYGFGTVPSSGTRFTPNATAQGTASNPRSHNWGRGQVLGDH